MARRLGSISSAGERPSERPRRAPTKMAKHKPPSGAATQRSRLQHIQDTVVLDKRRDYRRALANRWLDGECGVFVPPDLQIKVREALSLSCRRQDAMHPSMPLKECQDSLTRRRSSVLGIDRPHRDGRRPPCVRCSWRACRALEASRDPPSVSGRGANKGDPSPAGVVNGQNHRKRGKRKYD